MSKFVNNLHHFYISFSYNDNKNKFYTKEFFMKSTWKWILGIGAAVFAVVLIGLLFLNHFWLASYAVTLRHGMRGGYSLMPYSTWSPFGVLILVAFVLLLIFGILFLVIRSKPKAISETEIASNPLEICPGCGADLEPTWKYCPFCDYDLS